jgi:cellobiose-specific phosphotransferase system component IIC
MNKTLIVISIIVAVLIGAYLVSNKSNKSITLGGLSDSSFTGTTTNSTYANSIRMIKTTPGLLHNVVVGGTSATIVEFRDATSTTDIASTSIHVFAASPSTNTYTFDRAFSRGLGVIFTGSFTGNYTVNYK